MGMTPEGLAVVTWEKLVGAPPVLFGFANGLFSRALLVFQTRSSVKIF